MLTLEITESAEGDLDRITDYIGLELSNPPAAMALLDEVERVCAVLEDDPEMFPLCNDPHLQDIGYRKVVVRSYIMIYEVDECARAVRILRFFHGSEDYEGKL